MEQLKQTEDFLRARGIANPEIGIVLGTGLGKIAELIEAEQIIEYSEIPNFPLSTVESHAGRLVYGKLKNKMVLAMQGRFHFYEGYSMQQITLPIRTMKLLGIRYLLLSNAAGAMNLGFKKGSLMLITDHINLLPTNPLIGKNYDQLGPRFPDMSKAYSAEMNAKFREISQSLGIKLNEGVYAAVSGPNLETPAEYRFLSRIGADVVGMSTIPEVIVANHMSLPCAAISVLTDECDPDNLKAVDISEILEVAAAAEKELVSLFLEFIDKY